MASRKYQKVKIDTCVYFHALEQVQKMESIPVFGLVPVYVIHSSTGNDSIIWKVGIMYCIVVNIA